MQRNSKFPADQAGLVTGQENHNTRLLAVMEIKAFPNGASAGHGAVPKSRPGQTRTGV